MKRILGLVAVVTTAALLAVGCGGNNDEDKTTSSDSSTVAGESAAPSAATIMVTLSEQNGSGVTGTATITADGSDKTKVSVELNGDDGNKHPAHLHQGTCAKLNPQPKYPLTEIENGTSETTLNVPFEQIEAGPLALNVHKSDSDLKTYLACGDLASTTASSMSVPLAAVKDSGVTGTATLTAVGSDKTKVSVKLVGDDGTKHPAHIHEGTCVKLNAQPKYPLTEIQGGASETTLNVPFADLKSGGSFAINVHKSDSDLTTYLACGDLLSEPAEAGGDTSEGGGGAASTTDTTEMTDTGSGY